MNIGGKSAIITGGGSGIGRAVALRFAGEGASVVVVGRNDANGFETVEQIEKAGGTAAWLHADVSRAEDIDAMFAFTEKNYGGFDILCNNAGTTTGMPRWPDCSEEQWMRTLEVDLIAVVRATHKAIPLLKRRGGGVIVQIASMAGLFGFPMDPVYGAAKHGVVGLTRSLVNLKQEANIRVNCICPGFVKTPFVTAGIQSMAGVTRDEAERRVETMPMLPPGEIAAAVYELIRDDEATGVVMGVSLGDTRHVVDPPITPPPLGTPPWRTSR
jgi:NAD(P)-dependent dehydrogenase (short-subunit alcohol dehydrogenase family)